MSTTTDKSPAFKAISAINAVEGFDPTPLAVKYDDLTTGETRLRLPVMAQIAWFRLKYPEGRISKTVTAGNNCFVATARVYKNYNDPVDCFLAEGTASRTYLPEKPTVSPREWAQTAAVGIALRDAGFGLQFHAAGDSFDYPTADEFGDAGAVPVEIPKAPVKPKTNPGEQPGEATEIAAADVEDYETTPSAPAEELTFETAKAMPCPIVKYDGKTLGDLILLDPKALNWVATKFGGDEKIAKAAQLICMEAVKQAS